MPEGDTIHRAAQRMNAALRGKEIVLADAPSPRSPVFNRASELQGRTLTEAEAFGKHLVVHFSDDVAVHSHLGMNGRWFIAADGRLPHGRPWLRLAHGRAMASQSGGKLLRIVSESRLRNDPMLRGLGPDPLRPGFDEAGVADRLRRLGAGREIGDVLLDQQVIAGIGNAIRVEGLFQAGVSPWRMVEDLSEAELDLVVAENVAVMRTSMAKGRRAHSIYRANRKGCPRCGGRVRSRGQGDDNRIAYWCEGCQS
jgi:endonuclease VIII